jgi:hypothetical protein
MLVDEINYSANENSIRFTATGRSIYQSTFFIDDVLPCLLLEQEGMVTF